MGFKAAVLREHSPTDLAGERPLSAVGLQVNLHVAG